MVKEGGDRVNCQTDRPIYLQVIDDIRHKFVRGELSPGEKLPSIRELALQYRINPNTAGRVYREMELMGLCFTKRGTGTFLTEDAGMFRQIRKKLAEEYVDTFLDKMGEMGITLEEMLHLVKNRYSEKQRET